MALLSVLAPGTWLVLTTLRLLAPGDILAQGGGRVPEYELKAVFLFHFAQFVEWHPAPPDAPLVIGILGDDPFGKVLDETVRGERLASRPFEVRRFQHLEDIQAASILYISKSEQHHLDDILTSLRDRPVLTVSDVDRFAERGGMIGFITDRNRIRLRINSNAAKAARLTISSKLLRVSEIVGTPAR
jgi:hypothetical protein